ncbi:MAG TPA: L,D-transpeptidase [Longimicrobium sp.]|jgi:lipoprotein-anchoring transpeptidase ErfK/SrfK|uniref:L,D-transpeptidase n=1 Tax=Longimicrobium sp. TaxID=2029185 RepID=UPI002ED7DA10
MSLALAMAAALIAAPAGAAQEDSTSARAETEERRTPSGPFSLIVDLSERELYVMRGDEVERTYPVAIGKPEHPTPRGAFNVRRLIWNPRWVPPDAAWARNRRARAPGDPRNPMGRVKIFFRAPDYYIHGTHQEDSLGQAESHGCIRMRNADVIELARMVMENGGARRSPSWFQQVINRVRSTAEVGLSSPVSLRIRE